MKKLLLAAALFGGTMFTNVQAQFTGGSAGRETVNSPTITKQVKEDKGVFDNAFYIKLGKSSPKGKFGEAPNLSYSAFDSFNGVDGSGAQGGFNFEIGLLSYLRNIELQDQFKVGIDGGLGFSTNSLDWSTMDGNYDNSNMAPMFFAGFKIGPAFSYNIVDKLIVDAFFKLNPSIVYNPEIYYSDYSSSSSYSYSLYSENDVSFSVRKCLGINVRYGALLLGMELDYGKVNVTLQESYTTSSGPSGKKVEEVNMPTTAMLWTIGVKF